VAKQTRRLNASTAKNENDGAAREGRRPAAPPEGDHQPLVPPHGVYRHTAPSHDVTMLKLAIPINSYLTRRRLSIRPQLSAGT
jgi:hypothetical protein